MELIFIVIVVILAILAVLDLIVGVANDAINFLNSALGSKAAPHKVILSVAACGILVGVLTSGGMMEVARNGVFHPGEFTFSEIMMLFVGMMLSDVIILHTFNSLGLPTSTTVSLVSELLGSAVAVAVYKIYHDPTLTIDDLGLFINSGKAMVIISAILLSVVIAFTVGSTLMYISRIIFSFRYNKMFRRIGAIWCGVALTGIMYFAVFKGLGESGMLSRDILDFINNNLLCVLIGVWAVASMILAIFQKLNFNILKFTILSGTFSLALAFAGNDLVNFIGVPLAGFDSFKIALATGDMSMKMTSLTEPVTVNVWLMLGAGFIMVLTLFKSRNAMKVAQTELSLSSQHDGDERFSSTAVSRSLVRFALTLGNFYNYVVPTSLQKKINDRFIPLPEEERTSASYDMIRSVVNLSAASILICIGTSFQLPLSTTYVVFMVAMGSSLADRAWGRESAVYRITGVMVVIAGWFVTAIAGFIMSFLIGMFLMSTKWVALIILVVFCIYKFTSGFFRKNKKDETTYESVAPSENDHDTLYNYTEVICTTMQQISEIYNHMLIALFTEDRKALREAKQQSEQLYKEASQRKYEILPTIRSLQDRRIETAHFYVQVVDYLCEVTKALLHCTRPAYEHIDNNHRGLTEEQILDLKVVNDEVENIFSSINTMLQAHDFANMHSVLDMREALFDIIAERIKNQIHRIKGGEASTRGSALYFNILNETKTMILQSRNVLKSQSYFYESMN